ncbi:MAG: beta-glucosidase, partial [Chloroflexi bacterium]|nr:beta-glucosidase [Chloroflexota bacterium]
MTSGQGVTFPEDFVWGAATASYQIEGAVHEDGRGESIWDRFCTMPGKVRNGESGAIACDHYHRFADDVALMRALGLDAYRFSVAWPRILPEGRGTVNPKGLDFYDRLVDELLDKGIEPFATLYHWDLPQTLEDRGGWTNRETVEAYVEYVEAVVRKLGDRVRHWITHNEPWVAAWLGYGMGVHAPGRTGGEREALAAAHHLLLSHGRALGVIRGIAPEARVGITLNLAHVYPASDRPEDVEAARLADGSANRWFLDPVFRGEYPADMVALLQEHMPAIEDGDLQDIAAPLDFLGVNNYSRTVVRANSEGRRPIPTKPENAQFTDMGWEVYPEGLFDLLARLHRDYAPPSIYITENGAAFGDVRLHDGSVRDPERQAFLESYTAAAGRAIEAGVPLHGYFVWSLLDNFEWAFGYSKRFGIIYVDYPTLERVPKA